ncbi:MAG: response regulator [candidate division Zixibacteria bacterium]|nr:response regulator [candidate division Zixibacteria bacterium]
MARDKLDVKSIKILFIDDEPEITKIVQTFFSNAGFKCDVGNSAIKGLAKAKNNIPDVVLLDIVMPEMDGIELCGQLKQDPETENIPVLLLTGNDAKYESAQVYQTGCDLLIKKPFSCERLMDMVLTICDSANK